MVIFKYRLRNVVLIKAFVIVNCTCDHHCDKLLRELSLDTNLKWFLKLKTLFRDNFSEFYKLCFILKTTSELVNTSDIVDFIWIPSDDFVDEFRFEWETSRQAELIYNEQQKLQRKQMSEKTETSCTVKRWKIAIIAIGKIKCQRRRKLLIQLHNNENILNWIMQTL